MQKVMRWFRNLHYPSYAIFFVTARCNARCRMCFYQDNMDANAAKDELSLEEYAKIAQSMKMVNILGISGGEPFIRKDLEGIVKIFYEKCSPYVVDIPTNGYFVESVARQVEAIAASCPKMVVDIQLSIDGPEDVHNRIRGLKGSYARLRDTYKQLIGLKQKYKNLRVKACVVYSYYNQGHMEELFDILKRDFPEFDRVVFSVAHGSVSNEEAMRFDWDKYFQLCERVRRATTINNLFDFHSLFTVSLRVVKNEFLKDILKKKDMYRHCRSGESVIVVNEKGKVFPCEPLWEPVGDLRRNSYDLQAILDSTEMAQFKEKIKKECCQCHWGLPMSNSLLYSPRYYPLILREMAHIFWRSMGSKNSK